MYKIFFLLLLLPSVCFAKPPQGETVPVELIRVIDGDTVEVEIKRRIIVRLENCWAPEITGDQKEEGLKSKKFLEDWLKVSKIELFIPYKDGRPQYTFGRVVGRLYSLFVPKDIAVIPFWEDVSEVMVKTGYATQTKE